MQVAEYLPATPPPSLSHTLTSTTTMSTTYSSYRRQPTTDQAHDKYRQKAQQLKEFFPDWATEGASSLSSRATRSTHPFFSLQIFQAYWLKRTATFNLPLPKSAKVSLILPRDRSFLLISLSRPGRTMGFRSSQEGQKAPKPHPRLQRPQRSQGQG